MVRVRETETWRRTWNERRSCILQRAPERAAALPHAEHAPWLLAAEEQRKLALGHGRHGASPERERG